MFESLRRVRDYAACSYRLGSGPRSKLELLWKQTKNLRVRLGVESYHPDRIYAVDTTCGRLYFRDNFGDITNLVSIFHREVYRTRPASGDGVILDVGANVGLAAAWLANRHPGRPIHCFEPLASNLEVLRLNCPPAVVVRAAVGTSSGRVRLRVDPQGIMASAIPCDWETREEAFETLSLDEYTSARSVSRVAVLKIDTEGMELDILKGASRTLTVTDQVVMETHGRERHEDAASLLRAAGFGIDRESFKGGTGLLAAAR